MKHLSISLLAIITVIASCSSCKKNTDPAPDNPYGLPNATQTGANIFACRINGGNFISHYSLNGTKAGFYNDTFGMNGSNGSITSNLVFQEIDFTIFSNQQVNIDFDFSKSLAKSIYATDSTCQGLSSVVRSDATSGFIRLTKYDKNSKIVSGIFEAVYPSNNCDTLKVTDGRFDFNY